MKKLVIVLFIALAGVGGYALYLRHQTNDLQAQLAEALPQPVVPAEAAALIERMRSRQNEPVSQDLLRAQTRRMLPLVHPNLGIWLELTPEQESTLLDLIARQESDQRASGPDPARRDDPAARSETYRRMEAQRVADEAELSALLGDKYPKWRQYRQTRPLQQQVGQLQAMLGSGADRLGNAQALSLTTALVREQLRIERERTTPFNPSMNPHEYMELMAQRALEHKRLLEVAAEVLNPRQLESYRALIREEEEKSTALYRNIDTSAAAWPASDQ